jgi:hypothetical protein
MRNRSFVLLALVAASCAGCDGKSPVSPTPPPDTSAPSRFSVRQMSTLPVDGATLAYGQSGRVEIAYTLQGDQEPPPTMPREEYAQMSQFMARPIYQVMSCLSLDGVKCIVNASVSMIGGSDGAVWNTLALSDTFRGRVGQTAYVVHQLTVTRAGSTQVVAREVKSLHWHFQ